MKHFIKASITFPQQSNGFYFPKLLSVQKKEYVAVNVVSLRVSPQCLFEDARNAHLSVAKHNADLFLLKRPMLLQLTELNDYYHNIEYI